MNTPWAHTRSGVPFDLIAPTPDMIDWREMSVALARIPRFAAQTIGKPHDIYSVAQHQLEGAAAIVRDLGDRTIAAMFLLHDAHEFVIGDITTPVQKALIEHGTQAAGFDSRDAFKKHVRDQLAKGKSDVTDPAFIIEHAFHRLKKVIDEAIYKKAGFKLWQRDEHLRILHEYDVRMCRTERDALLSPCDRPWGEPYASAEPVKGVDLYPWSIDTVAALYEAALHDLLPVFQQRANT